MSSLSPEIIEKAESFPGIQAGIAPLDELLKAPSYRVVPEGEWSASLAYEGTVPAWPSKAESVLVLGLHHPEDSPQLDWWDAGTTLGNRRLMEVSGSLKGWLQEEHGLHALPLPYHVERGGLFLKDAAVLAGLGVVGKNNLLLNPQWGPRIRLHSVLLEGQRDPSRPVEGFFPCVSCDEPCRFACPRNAFSSGDYSRPKCISQLNADIRNKMPEGETGGEGASRFVIKYCRSCEMACPVGEEKNGGPK